MGFHLKEKLKYINPVYWLRVCYDFIMSFAEKPSGAVVLNFISFIESSVFPIPPEFLLAAICVARKKESFRLTLNAVISSVFGGFLGYFIGWSLYEAFLKNWIIHTSMAHEFETVVKLYKEYDAWVVIAAGIIPIPYKVFSIAGGVCKINLPVFGVASLISRSLRFFTITLLVYWKGQKAREVVDKYFDQITILSILIAVLIYLIYRIAR